jgi:hypothetical protein
MQNCGLASGIHVVLSPLSSWSSVHSASQYPESSVPKGGVAAMVRTDLALSPLIAGFLDSRYFRVFDLQRR